jgi:hypothetical protein
MTLVRPIFDPARGFLITDPIKIIYVKTDSEFVPSRGYCFGLYGRKGMIIATNKFKMVNFDNIELFELEFLDWQIISLMSHCHIFCYIKVLGWSYGPSYPYDEKHARIDTYDNIYYQIDPKTKIE